MRIEPNPSEEWVLSSRATQMRDDAQDNKRTGLRKSRGVLAAEKAIFALGREKLIDQNS
jgi:hypothetical protein